ncbi:hypothetical protein [Roseibium album]|uniref:hypothetical protein n=1 Tax=Roseibium album TaxID=311410 RepID=UPI00329952DE
MKVNDFVRTQTIEVEYHPLTKKKIKETFLDDQGRPHRDDGPALRTFSPTGLELSSTYFQHGVITRGDGPAIELIDLENQYHKLVGMKGGLIDREGGPAEICTDLISGVEFSVCFYRQNKMHRVGGEALITRDRSTGEINAKFAVIDGQQQPLSSLADFTPG